MTFRFHLAVFLLVVIGLQLAHTEANVAFLSPAGIDGPSCGNVSHPCASLSYILRNGLSSDIFMLPGNYSHWCAGSQFVMNANFALTSLPGSFLSCPGGLASPFFYFVGVTVNVTGLVVTDTLAAAPENSLMYCQSCNITISNSVFRSISTFINYQGSALEASLIYVNNNFEFANVAYFYGANLTFENIVGYAQVPTSAAFDFPQIASPGGVFVLWVFWVSLLS